MAETTHIRITVKTSITLDGEKTGERRYFRDEWEGDECTSTPIAETDLPAGFENWRMYTSSATTDHITEVFSEQGD